MKNLATITALAFLGCGCPTETKEAPSQYYYKTSRVEIYEDHSEIYSTEETKRVIPLNKLKKKETYGESI